MTSPFEGYEVEKHLRPSAADLSFDLDQALSSLVVLRAKVPDDAFTAETLGTERLGNGIVISESGLVLTIGYLITEAEDVTLITNDDRRVSAHVLGVDAVTGFGLMQALEPLDLPALSMGDSRKIEGEGEVIVAGGGGRAHTVAAHLVARAPFAGYWEYLLEEALFTAPGHPHWSGAALIGPTGVLMGVGSLQMNHEGPGGHEQTINMSVPIELLPPIVDDLARGRAAQEPRPWLGLFAHDSEGHVVVMGVSTGGPADRAEVRGGDVVLAVGGRRVASLAEFYTRLWALGPAGVRAPLRLRREGDVFEVSVKTGDRAARMKKRRFN
jgi:S1-C subfamily serine protease